MNTYPWYKAHLKMRDNSRNNNLQGIYNHFTNNLIQIIIKGNREKLINKLKM